MASAHSRCLALLFGLTVPLAGGGAIADMYRWVDAKGVVNYSNIPPPAKANAKRIADTEPTVSVIPLPERPPAVQREANEAALVRRIEQLEDELAQLRRAAAQPPAYARYAAPPMVGYAEYSWPIAYPVPVYPWPIRPGKSHHAGFRAGPFKHPVAVHRGARHGFNVRIGR